MSKVIIKTVDGVETATAIVEFDMGEVLREKVSEDGKSRTVSITANVDGMMGLFEQLMYEKAQDGNEEGFKEMLEQYSILRLNKVIGVESTPLCFDNEGKLKGLSESVEVEFERSK